MGGSDKKNIYNGIGRKYYRKWMYDYRGSIKSIQIHSLRIIRKETLDGGIRNQTVLCEKAKSMLNIVKSWITFRSKKW